MRALNYFSKTTLQQHEKDQDDFKKLMPLLSNLNDDEKRSLVHLMKNQASSRITPGHEAEIHYINEACSSDGLADMAKTSETENYATKNHFLH